MKPILNQICPNCLEPFTVKKQGTIYCSDWCCDTYYNHHIRGKRYTIIHSTTKPNSNSLVENLQIKPTSELLKNDAALKGASALQKNIQILSALEINSRKGTHYDISYLHNLSFNFNAFEFRARLHNIDDKYNCRYLIMGDFKLFRTDYKTILVHKVNP